MNQQGAAACPPLGEDVVPLRRDPAPSRRLANPDVPPNPSANSSVAHPAPRRQEAPRHRRNQHSIKCDATPAPRVRHAAERRNGQRSRRGWTSKSRTQPLAVRLCSHYVRWSSTA